MVSVVAAIGATVVAAAIIRLFSRKLMGDLRSLRGTLKPGKIAFRGTDPMAQASLGDKLIRVDPGSTIIRRRSSEDMYEKLFTIEDLDADVEAYRMSARDDSTNSFSSDFHIQPLSNSLQDSGFEQFDEIPLATDTNEYITTSTPKVLKKAGAFSVRSVPMDGSSVIHVSIKPDRTGCLGVILGDCGSEIDEGITTCDGANGANMKTAETEVVVKRLLPGGAGWLSDLLQPGDVLLCVQGRSVCGMPKNDVIRFITEVNTECGELCKEVKLVVRRPHLEI